MTCHDHAISGDNDLPGLTDTEKPRMRGPKRATKIRKLFNLTKEDDVRKYVNTYRRTFVSATGECAFHELSSHFFWACSREFCCSFGMTWIKQAIYLHPWFLLLSGKKRSKAPKIQRLVTPLTLQRKRQRVAIKKERVAKSKTEAAEYQKLLALRIKEQREHRSESLAKKRASRASIAKAEASA